MLTARSARAELARTAPTVCGRAEAIDAGCSSISGGQQRWLMVSERVAYFARLTNKDLAGSACSSW